ncbi:MAG: hypothetical protein ACRD38_00955 [Nitrososphaerales archaeon]
MTKIIHRKIQKLSSRFAALTLSAILLASITVMVTNTEPAYAALSVKKGSFDTISCNPPTSACDQSITGVGFQPKALILFTNVDLVPNTGFQNEIGVAIGFSDGADDRSISIRSEDLQDTSDTGRTSSETHIIKALSWMSSSIVLEFDVKSFDSDGFTITYSAGNSGIGASVQYIALGGSDITNVDVGTITSGTSTGNVAYTVGFQPNFIMFMYTRQNGTSSQNEAEFGLGFASSSSARGAVVAVSEDARATSDTHRAQRTDRVIYQLTPSTGNVNAEADFVSFDSNGFTLNWSDLPNNTNDKFYYMAIKGGKYKVGTFTQPTTGTPPFTQAITGVGFQPTGLMLASFNNVAASTVQSHSRLSFGASDGTNEGAMWFGDKDNVGTTVTEEYSDTAKVIRLATETTPTTDAEADLQSFDSDGFTLNWTTRNDATAREIIYIALGNT